MSERNNDTVAFSYKVIKFFLFFAGFILIAIYVGDKQEKCNDYAAGMFIGIFLVVSYVMFFIEELRHKAIEMLKLYIPAIFILYSGVFYFENLTVEKNLQLEKEYLDRKLTYAAINFKGSDKNMIDEAISEYINKNNESIEIYSNKMLSTYKRDIGKAMIGLTIGLLVILSLDVLNMLYRRDTDLNMSGRSK